MIYRLFPDSGRASDISLEGLYLRLNLHHEASEGEVLIYSNYVASIDGRISRYNPTTDNDEVPNSLANERDWRLYQELAAQSDVLVTSARYFRQLASGTAQEMLPVGHKYQDLMAWRIQQRLKKQPAVAILSRTLEIPLDAIELLQERQIYVFTSDTASTDKRALLETYGVKVISAGETGVEGIRLREGLIDCGFKSAYMIAGPEVHGTLIAAGVLNRMFLTTRFTFLGNEHTHGLCEGGLSVPPEMNLQALYRDEKGQQLFADYAVVYTAENRLEKL